MRNNNASKIDAKIARLKKKAAVHLLAWRNEFSDMSCGASLGRHIRGGSVHAKRFNEIMDQLAEIDPACPSHRLPEK